MDRVIIYPGQVPLETDLLQTNKFTMIALSKLAAAILGTSTLVNGLSVVPTGPASLSVNVNPGEIYSAQNVDATAYSSLPIDTHSIVKQGISLDVKNLACAAPGTAGQSVNYLVQAAYSDTDSGSITLPYYNASNPAVAYSGPNGSGVAQNTLRQGLVNVTAKPGVAATTGSQTTPAPDAGFVGLYVVTVANGQTTINAGNITTYTGAPIITETLTQKISQSAADARYAAGVRSTFHNLTVDSVGVNNYNVVIAADEAVLENSAGLFITQRAVSKTVNMNGTVGAPLSIMSVRAASTWYYPWLWYNATLGLTATMDASSSAPTPPTGYTASDYKAPLPGEKYTDATAGKYPLQLRTTDYTSKYVLLAGSNVAALPQMTSGAQGNINTPTWVAVATGAFVPPSATKITVLLGGGSTPGSCSAAPNNLYGSHTSSNPPPLSTTGQTGPVYVATGEFALESTNIYYASSAASCVMNCYKWESAR